MKFMLTLIIGGTIVLIGASVIFFSKKKEDGGITNGELTESDKNWELTNQDKEFKEESGINMDKFPGWSEDQVKKYLESGWSEEQLAEWYQQQIDNNTAQD